MTILENVLEDNKKFVENFEGEEMSHHAQKKLAILTCMDCRLIDFFEPALGLERGDAKIVRNAGNSIVGEDAIRSIGAALYNLGCEEVLVVGHTECGMAGADAEALKEKDIDRFLKLVNESGESSCALLQNLYSCKNPLKQEIPLAIALSKKILKDSGAVRVHGGGFAGTIQAFVPENLVDDYTKEMERLH